MRTRDAVESALSDIILLGTEEQVRLAGFAAQELVEGRHVPTHDLVVSLRHLRLSAKSPFANRILLWGLDSCSLRSDFSPNRP